MTSKVRTDLETSSILILTFIVLEVDRPTTEEERQLTLLAVDAMDSNNKDNTGKI